MKRKASLLIACLAILMAVVWHFLPGSWRPYLGGDPSITAPRTGNRSSAGGAHPRGTTEAASSVPDTTPDGAIVPAAAIATDSPELRALRKRSDSSGALAGLHRRVRVFGLVTVGPEDRPAKREALLFAPYQALYRSIPEREVEVVTDADGFYSVTLDAPGTYRATFDIQAHQQAIVLNGTQESIRQDLRFFLNAKLIVSLIPPENAHDGTVQVRRRNDPWWGGPVTKAPGDQAIPYTVPPGEYVVKGWTESPAAYATETVSLEEGEEKSVVLGLETVPILLEGRVVELVSGNPIWPASVAVTVDRPGSGAQWLTYTSTNREGLFAMPVRTPGSYRLRAASMNYGESNEHTLVVTDSDHGRRFWVEIALEAMPGIYGVVYDWNGNPVPECHVRVDYDVPGGHAGRSASTTEAGEFRFDNLPRGTAGIEAEHIMGASDKTTVPVPSGPIALYLHPLSQLAAVVLQQNGQRFEGECRFILLNQNQNVPMHERHRAFPGTYRPSNGVVLLGGVRPGLYRLQVSAVGYPLQAESEPFEVAEDSPVVRTTLVLSAPESRKVAKAKAEE